MLDNSSNGLKLLTKLIVEKNSNFSALGVDEELFIRDEDKSLYQGIYAHVCKYGEMPSRETVETKFFLPPSPTDTIEYFRDECRKEVAQSKLGQFASEVTRLTGKGEIWGAVEVLDEGLREIRKLNRSAEYSELYDEGGQMVFDEYLKKQAGSFDGWKFGWPYIDKQNQGIRGGDLVTFSGRPGTGKTMLSLHIALNMWRKGASILFVSMEMKPVKIYERLISMLTSKPLDHVEQAQLTPQGKEEMWEKYSERRQDNSFQVMDGKLAVSVGSILNKAIEAQSNVVFVDGAYLVKHNARTSSTWERVAGVAEALKSDVAEGLNIPVVATFQLNREADKRRKGAPVDLSNIGYSDSIGQLSSLAFALSAQDTNDLRQRHIDIMKGRYGESGSFDINWNFDEPPYMDFSEVEQGGDLIVD